MITGLTVAQIGLTAFPAPAFSNGFEGERWTDAWCGTCRHDSDFGGTGECPLLSVAMIGESTPREWREVSLGGLENRYECERYEPREGEEDARLALPQVGSGTAD